MGRGEERRKLLCQCGKPLGIFTAQGLELYCRFSKESCACGSSGVAACGAGGVMAWGRDAGARARGRGGR